MQQDQYAGQWQCEECQTWNYPEDLLMCRECGKTPLRDPRADRPTPPRAEDVPLVEEPGLQEPEGVAHDVVEAEAAYGVDGGVPSVMPDVPPPDMRPQRRAVPREQERIGVVLRYPNVEGMAKAVQVDLEDVRAADGLVVSYDFDRDGWVIHQQRFTEDEQGIILSVGGWYEVAFVQAWQLSQVVRPEEGGAEG